MKTKKIIWKGNLPPQQRQKGVIAVIVAIGIAALIGVVGLALDSGHLLLNKTRLQNAVDAAALSGGKVLLTSTSGTPMVDARVAAEATFTANFSSELNGDAVTFSEDLTPGSFTATVADPKFIKVSSPVISLTSFLIKAVGFDDKQVAAVAVAGFGSGAGVCDMIPVMVCGDADDTDHNDGTIFGYKKFDYDNPDSYDPETDEINLKMGTAEGWDPETGSGNYHLLNVGGTGGNLIRHSLAGAANCGIQDGNNALEVNTAPGGKVGPVASGINTRFGEYEEGLKASDYPADYANRYTESNCDDGALGDYINVASGAADGTYDIDTGKYACLDPRNYFEAYDQHSTTWSQTIGPAPSRYLRRKVTMPIADCGLDGDANGRSDLPTLGFGCFLLTRPVDHGGSGSDNGSMFGVFLEQCFPPTEGIAEENGTTIIVLYKNPDGADS